MSPRTWQSAPWLVLGTVFLLVGCVATSSDSSGDAGATGTVTGTVIDATSGLGASGATVATVDGASATTAQTNAASTQTDANGQFSLAVSPGSQQIEISKTGYDSVTVTVTVVENQTTDVGDIILSPTLTSGQVRVVLTWGANPSDLDLHALTPDGNEIYYANPIGTGINLDVDDTDSYGPETITITSQQSGDYCFFVHNYSGSLVTTFGNSGAQIEVYTATGLQNTVTVPAGSTTSTDYWNLLTINGTTITVINTYSTSIPTCAGDGGGGGAPVAINLNTAVDGSVALDAFNVYVATVSPGSKYLVSLYGMSADVDLYLSHDNLTTATCTIDNTVASFVYPEDCTITASGSSLYIGVYGYEAGSYTVYITPAPTSTTGSNEGASGASLFITAHTPTVRQVGFLGTSYYYVTGLSGTVTVNLAGISDTLADVDLYLYQDFNFTIPLTCSPDNTVFFGLDPEDCTVTGYSTLYIKAVEFNDEDTQFVLMVH